MSAEGLKTAVRTVRDATGANIEHERSGFWVVYDSPLLEGRDISYGDFFNGILPEKFADIKEYLESLYKKRKGAVVGVEMGGPGSKLFSGFSPGFLRKSFGVTLFDRRSEEQRKIDAKHGHEVIAVDMFSTKGHRAINKKLEGAKVDFIVEKMHAGFTGFPEDPKYLLAVLNRWYRLLNEGGVMMVESPTFDDESKLKEVVAWLGKTAAQQNKKIDLSYKIFPVTAGKRIKLRIQKLEGAPETLIEEKKGEREKK